ncbi:MAG TPA: ABC-2 transporter permease [Firmicutes bacterium]|nr:ABC-2 transporter permease [Bacillales bacterium]HJA41083.1 ABC-2 transporter permease [Bacillota bacterium]
MQGLLLKDFYILKQYMKFGWVFLIISFIEPQMLVSILIIFMFVFSISSFSYDEQANWSKFVNTLAITNKQIVASKYIFMLMSSCITTLAAFIFLIIYNQIRPISDLKNLLLVLSGGIGIFLIMISIFLPFLFKFGSQKSRFILILVAWVPIGIAGFLGSVKPLILDPIQIQMFCLAVALIDIIALYISYLCSVNIYQNKEF